MKKYTLNSVRLNTILKTAPLIIEGATKLIKLIRERSDHSGKANENLPLSVESLHQKVSILEGKLEANSESDVEQIRLIEQLARHNEVIAESLNKTTMQLKILTIVILTALVTAITVFMIIPIRL